METFGSIFPLVFWAALTIGIVWLVIRAVKKKSN